MHVDFITSCKYDAKTAQLLYVDDAYVLTWRQNYGNMP